MLQDGRYVHLPAFPPLLHAHVARAAAEGQRQTRRTRPHARRGWHGAVAGGVRSVLWAGRRLRRAVWFVLSAPAVWSSVRLVCRQPRTRRLFSALAKAISPDVTAMCYPPSYMALSKSWGLVCRKLTWSGLCSNSIPEGVPCGGSCGSEASLLPHPSHSHSVGAAGAAGAAIDGEGETATVVGLKFRFFFIAARPSPCLYSRAAQYTGCAGSAPAPPRPARHATAAACGLRGARGTCNQA